MSRKAMCGHRDDADGGSAVAVILFVLFCSRYGEKNERKKNNNVGNR